LNPLQDIYDRCNTGDNLSKYEGLADFPSMLDIEPTSSCNFRCLMCPTGNRSLERKAEFMKWEVFEKIADQCAEHGAAIRFIGWGEPTLHPMLLDMLRYAGDRGILTHLNTNGSKITPDLARKLVESGLSSIKFSFQGASRETYAEMRRTDFFDGMVEAIIHMREARGQRNLPYIAASTTITSENPAAVAAFRRRLAPVVDHLTIGHTIFDFMNLRAVRLNREERRALDRLRGLETAARVHPNPCPEVFDKLSINASGDVVVCCNDYNGTVALGNVRDTPLRKIWRHEKIEAYRRRLSRNNYKAPLCESCYDYQGLTAGATNNDS
jgi:radical SAM protein with 4Fe4S-binding SPASM domain